MSDSLGASYTIGTVLVFLIISEGSAKLGKISKETARKIIHISVGNVIFFVPLFETRWIAAGIPAIFVLGNYLLSPLSPLEKLRLTTFKAGHTWGTILYPLSLSISVFVFFNQPWLIIATFFPVVYGDGFAAIFGPKAQSGHFTIFGNSKTLIGTMVISFFSWFSVIIGIVFLGFDFQLAIIFGLFVAIATPLIEILSPRGTDNFVIPVSLTIIFTYISDLLIEKSGNVDLNLYLIGIVFGLVFAVGGFLANVLTPDGAFVGFMITVFMLGVGSIAIGIQLFLFFVLGSGATKLVKNIAGSTQEEFEKGGERRDAIQALAKAGIPSILAFIFLLEPNVILFYIISGLMAAALIDTMSTEIGIAMKGYPFFVLTPWKRAESGETGVISIQGTLGGMFFGILFILISGWIAIIDPFKPLEFNFVNYFVIILIAGTLGMLVDSIFGRYLQRHYKCKKCDKIIESKTHHDRPADKIRGFSWFNNDITNICGTVVGGLFTVILVFI